MIADDRTARRNALILAFAQALAGGNSAVIFATGAIVGSTLAPSAAWATVPISIFVVGMATGTLPAGRLARIAGRRAAFQVGAGFGAAAGALGCTAVLLGSFPLFCLATFFGGLYNSISQSYRFAAADTASDAFKPKAISWVLAGGVFAGLLGPQLVTRTMGLWPPYTFAASYAAQVLVAIAAAAVLSTTKFPPPEPIAAASGRPLREIVSTPRFVAAALCGVVTYFLMNFVMTSAPLAMKMCGHSLSDSNLGIQWHIIAMFGPSFFTGSLIQRFGATRIVLVGFALTAAAALVALHGIDVPHFWAALILLGVGWNFGFVGASAMVVALHRPEERNKVQGFNDFLVFGSMAVGSFSSGHLLATEGWAVVNLIVFPALAFGLVVLIGAAWWPLRAATVRAASG